MPLLTHTILGEVLLLYMAITPEVGSSMLMTEVAGSQQPIYYASNIFKKYRVEIF